LAPDWSVLSELREGGGRLLWSYRNIIRIQVRRLSGMRTKYLAGAATLLWLLLVGGGFAALVDYGLTPGVAGRPPIKWPRASMLARNGNGPTLVMALHPHCPCSRASLAELASILNAQEGRTTAYVLFVRPPGVAPGWEQTDLWRQAAAIRGVHTVFDDLGRESARFGAATSGQTMLYDRDGVLRFSGGVTAARGFYGDSVGGRTIAVLLNDSRRLGGAAAYA
jgi:hypothetical protein